MTKLEIAKRVINDNLEDARCGLFDTRNLVGDLMETLYCQDGLLIDICYGYMYFEVFGLNREEFKKLHEYYERILVGNK